MGLMKVAKALERLSTLSLQDEVVMSLTTTQDVLAVAKEEGWLLNPEEARRLVEVMDMGEESDYLMIKYYLEMYRRGELDA
jgi:hypothetical protein